MNSRLYTFAGGAQGEWSVSRVTSVLGEVGELRASAEWKFIEHEVDIQLVR